jgi:hypothetical protein
VGARLGVWPGLFKPLAILFNHFQIEICKAPNVKYQQIMLTKLISLD